jgi:hypothetical protein
MAFAQLTYRESLRDIETCLRSISGFYSTFSRTVLTVHANIVLIFTLIFVFGDSTRTTLVVACEL